MKKPLIILIISWTLYFFTTGSESVASDLCISEILASNVSVNYDISYYSFSDWIELYNSSASAINLEGYYLTDDPDNLLKYRINYYLNISPGTHTILWAGSYNSYRHTNFSLDSDGEFIALVDPAGNIIDSVTFGQQYPDISYGRKNDTEPEWQYFDNPTPDKANGYGIALPEFSHEVKFSLEPGFYNGSVWLELSTENPVDEIRYTLQGDFPDAHSFLYSGPLNISSNTIIRARSYTTHKLASEIKSNSYFIHEDSLTLPAISISTRAAFLFDPMIGIYIAGENGVPGNCIDSAVNFNQDWERAVNLEYFLPSGEQVINQVVGIKINGGCSRNVPSKSFAIYAREKYGESRMKYPFFHNKDIPEYKNLILRNTGNDYYFAYMRDGFMQSLIAGVTDIEYQSYQPARIYINGKYWGILNMREKMNEHYLAANHGVDPDRVDLIESNSIVIEGSGEHYTDMMNFLRSNDIADTANYDYMCSLMDMDQFLDYIIAQIYYENEDWPNHNIKCWRPWTEDGRWRWLLYDTDYGFGRWPRTGNTVHWALMKNWEPTELASTLIDNPTFRNEFAQRFAVYLNTIFTPERVIHILDSLVNNLDTEMHLHIARWGSPWAHFRWKQHIELMQDFAEGRGTLLYQQIKDELDLEGTVSLELGSANIDMGNIKLHDVLLDSSLTLPVFRNIPLRVRAVPEPGFRFSHWSGANSSNNPVISLILAHDDSLTAHFTLALPIENLFINELSSLKQNGIPDEQGETEDWIELYNAHSEPIVLDNLFLTDSLGDPFKHRIRGGKENLIIQPGEYLIFYADNDPEQGKYHLNFKLSNQGETLALIQKTDSSYRIIDSVSFLKQYAGTTYGRSPLYPEQFQYLLPTPGTGNAEKRIENVVINEIMPVNRSTITDNKGEYEDWIEIYNKGEDAVSLSGMFLTDSLANKLRYHLPFTQDDSLTINPGEFIVLWADNQPEQGIRHLGFRLSGEGEALGLVQPSGKDFIDSLSFGNIRKDVALGRLPDGGIHLQYLTPSPGEPNHVEPIENIFINEVIASNRNTISDEYGEMDDWIELYNANDFAVDIGGLYITDSLSYPLKCRIPSHNPDSTTIPPQGYLRLWADNTPEQGILHLNFKLSRAGEKIGIARHDGTEFIDTLSYPGLAHDAAFGRIPDGGPHRQLVTPTPLEANRVDTLHNLFINEFMSSNTWTVMDEYGEYDDWIELYNANPFAVDIGGLYITDNLENPLRFKLPQDSASLTTIPAGGHLVLWADDQPEQGILHLNFRLSNSGEQIGLYLEDALTPIDSLTYRDNYRGASMGRFPDGSDHFEYMLASPGAPNSRSLLEKIFISEFVASTNSSFQDEFGEYNDWIELYNNNDHPVNIGGAFIIDSLPARTRFRIPDRCPDSTTIPAKGRLILWADNQPGQGVLHLNFALSGKGEQLGLFNRDGIQVIDSLSFPEQYPGISWGRKNDTLAWQAMRPTPGKTNTHEKTHGIIINEIMADNQNRVPDEYGNYSDWVELYNTNDFTVNIGGCFLTDSIAYPKKYRIPADVPEKTTIAPHAYLLIFADDSTDLGPLHTNFKLNRIGEELALYHFDAVELIDALSYSKQYKNFAYGKFPDKPRWISMPPTPMAPNHLPDLSGLVMNELMPDNDDWIADEHGEYDDWIELHNFSDIPVDIGGLFITDSIADRTKHRISSLYPDSTTIPPGGFMLLWADNDKEQGIHHLGFKLSKEGEEIGLFNYDGRNIDLTAYTITLGKSYGRRDNGNSDWTWFDFPTPGASNSFTSLPGNDPDEITFMVYPNPMTEFIRFVVHRDPPGYVTLEIYTTSGEKVYTEKSSEPTSHVEMEWNGTGRTIPAGLYVYRIISGEQFITGHFIKP